MTFGIDVSTYQAGIDLGRAKADGTEFVIVKAVAAYRPEHTVADDYHEHIDAAIAAGLPKGHYLVVNSRNTPDESAEFLAANLYRYTPGDVLALDNEPLGDYATFWDDAGCARFFRRLRELTGHDYQRMWWYCPASQTRGNGPWFETQGLGVVPWWVAYGSRPSGQTPDHEPSLQGSLTWWGVHQFTSNSLVAGLSVDGNFSPYTVDDLFGGGGMTAGYENVNGFIVILADNRDPWVSWANHLKRGSLGGVDVVAPVGTPIYAPADCVLANTPWNGTGGHTITLSFNDGWRDQMMHLSRFVEPGFKRKGDLVGYSGATASGKTNGVAPHVHWFRVDTRGVRRNPWNYFTTAGPSGGGYTPIEEEVADVATHRRFKSTSDFAVREHFQRFPWQTSPREENLAQSTGGAGLYDMILNLYLHDLREGAQVEGKFVLENADTKATSDGFLFTVDGSPCGLVRAAIPARISVPPRSNLYLELRASAGVVDAVTENPVVPVLDEFAVDVANLTVA